MKKNLGRNLMLIALMRLRDVRNWFFSTLIFLSGISRVELSENVHIMKGFRVRGQGRVFIGRNSLISKNVHFVVNDTQARIIVDEKVNIGDDVQIICNDSGEIKIGKNCKVSRGAKMVCYGNARMNIEDGVAIQEYAELKTNSLAIIGSGSVIGKYSSISPREQDGSGYFICGQKSAIHQHNFFDTTETVEIGNEVATGPYSIFYTHDHETRIGQSIWDQPAVASKIVIGDGAWIGSQVIILPGVKVGTGAVVAAGAVVTSDIDDFNIVAGVPARLLRKRD